MKKKKGSLKKLTAVPAAASVFALAASAAHAQLTPVFNYTFPASWGGTGTTITDQSTAGNNGFSDGTLSLSSSVPPGAGAGTESLVTSSGGILTSATSLLSNGTIAADGGFQFNVDFMWNGTDSSSYGHTEKLVDYAGTESLQLVTTSGSAKLQMQMANDTGGETVLGTTIAPNTWYNVSLDFNTEGASEGLTGDISGLTALYVNGTLAALGDMTKGTYGDGLNRPIGVGQLGANFGYLVGFKGDIYSASVNLGAAPVPEPSTLALSVLGGFGVMGMMWKGRRRKA